MNEYNYLLILKLMNVWKSYDWNYEIVSILYEKYMYDFNCFNIL